MPASRTNALPLSVADNGFGSPWSLTGSVFCSRNCCLCAVHFFFLLAKLLPVRCAPVSERAKACKKQRETRNKTKNTTEKPPSKQTKKHKNQTPKKTEHHKHDKSCLCAVHQSVKELRRAKQRETRNKTKNKPKSPQANKPNNHKHQTPKKTRTPQTRQIPGTELGNAYCFLLTEPKTGPKRGPK